MTARDWWLVGCGLLGVYFIVTGIVTGSGALMMTAMGLPEGSNRAVAVSVPLVVGGVFVVAGILLVRQAPVVATAASQAPPDLFSQPLRVGLRLLGIYLLVAGCGTVLGTAVQSYFVGSAWQFRAADLIAGAVDLVAGGMLALSPDGVVKLIFRGNAASRVNTATPPP